LFAPENQSSFLLNICLKIDAYFHLSIQKTMKECSKEKKNQHVLTLEILTFYLSLKHLNWVIFSKNIYTSLHDRLCGLHQSTWAVLLLSVRDSLEEKGDTTMCVTMDQGKDYKNQGNTPVSKWVNVKSISILRHNSPFE
jgi:hypothetical protein